MSLDAQDSLVRLQGLHADLVAFAESRLPNFERLWAELEDSIADFRTLLEHKGRNAQSRKAISEDTVTVDNTQYTINDEFRQEVIQVADELDIDELDATRLLLEAQTDAQALSRPASLAAIFRYHGQREALLGSLRISFHQAQDGDIEPEHREIFGQVAQMVVQQETNGQYTSNTYWARCAEAMSTLEAGIRRIGDRLVSISVIGETQNSFAMEALQFQSASLTRQHESLSGLLCALIKLGHAAIGDYQSLLKSLASVDVFDELVTHYIPILIALAAYFGSSDGTTNLRGARAFDQNFLDKSEVTRWKLPEFKAAAHAWWLAEYSGRYIDGIPGSPLQGVDPEKDSEARSDRLMQCLKDGAFHFILSACSRIKAKIWHDPAKTGLLAFLLGASYNDAAGSPLIVSSWFEEILADQLQIFIEAFIGNMPDTIRRLKAEEDDQRRNMGLTLSQSPSDTSFHLERFLTIISFAFSGSPDQALEAFWSDPDGNMYGFLQWASKRQSTPRAAAFCEMFQAIAENEECAEAAHKFLLDEAVGATSAKLRKGVSLSWAQIFSELVFYADRLRESPSALAGYHESSVVSPTTEPESALMLECYLRLTTHMCRNSEAAKHHILTHTEVRLNEVLLDLCRSGIESRFKACAFITLSSMLTGKTIDVSYAMWEALDNWVCGVQGGKTGGISNSLAEQPTIDSTTNIRLRTIASGFEESNAFVRLLQNLVEVPVTQSDLHDCLSFPEGLGSNYRMAGIEQYINFVLGDVMTMVLPALENQQHIWELRCACLDFIRTVLSSFNEDLVIFANTTNIDIDSTISTSSLANYVKLHPFSRVMEWMFNDVVITQLFAASHCDPDTLASSPPDSPMVTSVARSIQVIDMIVRLQPTYFDIVRPIIKTQSQNRSRPVANPTLATFEDAILANLGLVIDLGLYCSTAFEHLTSLSLELLSRLTMSRKLTGEYGSAGSRQHLNRLLVALQQTDEVERIATSFAAPLTIDAREMEVGASAPGYAIKLAILDLLDASLEHSNGRPGIAHCLLGFTCTERTLAMSSDSAFAQGTSVFHAIVRLYAETSNIEQICESPWLARLRCKAGEIIRKLSRSPLTSAVILGQLRDSGFNEALAVSQQPLSVTSMSGYSLGNPEFLATEDAETLQALVLDRVIYFEHQALELREAVKSSSITLREKTVAALLGLTTLQSGEQIQHANVFDLFDFFEEDLITAPQIPTLALMADLDFEICLTKDAEGVSTYDLRLVRELLLLREAALRRSGQLESEVSNQQAQDEVDTILLVLSASNRASGIRAAQKSASQSWTQIMIILLSSGALDGSQRLAFISQALQLVLPRVDAGLAQESLEVLPFLRLVFVFLQASNITGVPEASSDAALEERMVASCRSALVALTSSLDSPELRETAYRILALILSHSSSPALQKAVRKAIDSSGERLLEIMTEDGLSSTSATSVAALSVIGLAIDLFYTSKSNSFTRALTRLNFVAALVDSIRSIPSTFADRQSRPDLDGLVRYIQTNLNISLRLARDAKGADALLENGLFAAVTACGLFSADPDIGDVDGEEQALIRYYELLSGILHTIGAVVLVKGSRNANVVDQGRKFVADSRACIIAVLRAARKPDGLGLRTREVLSEVIDGFQVIMFGVDFLEFDDRPAMSAKKFGMSFT